jgi:nucleoside-diphosphate-sugar epimerase
VTGPEAIIDLNQPILVTGAGGFIGSQLLRCLRERGCRSVRALVRPTSDGKSRFSRLSEALGDAGELVSGNLLSKEDCAAVTKGVSVIYHLAAGTGTKSYADAYMNSVVTTRNLIEGALQNGTLRRLVNVSSFSVYTNQGANGVLDETCPIESRPQLRDAYCFAKTKQDELVADYGREKGLKYVIVRPGVVYGQGKERIHGRVGVDTFGVFLHLGGRNPLPLTHVRNCAEAIMLAGLKPGIEGQAFNIVDDDLPTSNEFLNGYKRNVRKMRSVYVPHWASYVLCRLWEAGANWSRGQLPAVYNRREWQVYWKFTRYSNAKAKQLLGWAPKVPTSEALEEFYAGWRLKGATA